MEFLICILPFYLLDGLIAAGIFLYLDIKDKTFLLRRIPFLVLLIIGGFFSLATWVYILLEYVVEILILPPHRDKIKNIFKWSGMCLLIVAVVTTSVYVYKHKEITILEITVNRENRK